MDSTLDLDGQALELVRASRRVLLVGHARPDGDCLGAQAALHRGLTGLGKEVAICNPDAPARVFDYLTRQVPYGVFGPGGLPPHDLVMLLDFNELSRTGPMAGPITAAPSRKMVVDHHPHDGEAFWDGSFVDVTASATGVLAWRLLKLLGAPIDALVATGVFTSMVTDTGWFRYSNTDAETLGLAGELVAAGVDVSAVYAALYQRRAPEEPRALGAVLDTVEYFADGRLAVAHQPLRSGPTLEDGDPLLDELRAVERVEVVLYLREIEPGVCKLSARSKTSFDVNALARGFGGGGHRKAAGATIQGPLDVVRGRLIAAAEAALGGGTGDSGEGPAP
jgi:phosphoesterase RecJ-like protein